eukprot:CAMPEP_0117430530 /NCGR_PEP_ID=MMETSP0758-20121206/10076_1 /TAXON_ID=63605 /ORGANISM="Percolomonas cosmopolitus, Strain AE-1 (ATCC 50343)" /LENGTH=709 /DNA_ID=CAMNT_0005218655 /DNA_START=393 /DNA_END=2519 /DNA_ORIENTATION=+
MTLSSQNDGINTLEAQLRKLDEKYNVEEQESNDAYVASIEDRMLAYQRQVDEQARLDYEAKSKMFEENIVSTMRLEEAAKYREKLSKLKGEIEKEYSIKLESLKSRESEMTELLNDREKRINKQAYEHRQKMMDEAQKLAASQADLKAAQFELTTEKKRLEDKESQLEILHNQMGIDMKTELSVLKKQLEKEYDEAKHSFMAERQLFEKEKIDFAAQRRAYQRSVTNHEEDAFLKETIEQQNKTLEAMKSDMKTIRKENQHLKQVNDDLLRENNQFKYASNRPYKSEAPNQTHLYEEKYQKVVNEKRELKSRVDIHIENINDLQKKNENLHQKISQLKAILEKERNDSQNALQQLRETMKEQLQRELSAGRRASAQETESIEKLENEIEGLKQKMGELRLENKKYKLDNETAQSLLRETKKAMAMIDHNNKDELEIEYKNSQTMIQKLTNDLRVKEKEQTLEITTITAEKDSQISNLKSQLKSYEQLKEKVEEQAQENEELKQKVENLQYKRNSDHESRMNEMKQARNYETELKSLQEERRQLLAKNEELKEHSNSYQKLLEENESLKQNSKRFETDQESNVKKLKESNSDLEKTIENMKKSLQNEKDEANQLKMQLDMEIRTKNQEKTALKTQNEELLQQIEKLKQTVVPEISKLSMDKAKPPSGKIVRKVETPPSARSGSSSARKGSMVSDQSEGGLFDNDSDLEFG